MEQKNIGTKKAWEKIRHYCAYQERNHQEVKEKLYSFGLYKDEVESLLAKLIEENYLNEERYALAFADGKFRIKQWGRIKIRYELKQNRVSDYCITKALVSICENEYKDTLKKLADIKLRTLRSEKNPLAKQKKLYSFLMQKGFEPGIIASVLKEI